MIKCTKCEREFKDNRGLAAHVRFKHSEESRPPLPDTVASEGVKEVDPLVVFTSPRSMGLRIIVSKSYWTEVKTPGGSHREVIPGKTAEFVEGVLRTTDPEIIDFLENRYESKRYPVVSPRMYKDQVGK